MMHWSVVSGQWSVVMGATVGGLPAGQSPTVLEVLIFALILAAFAFGWCWLFGHHYEDRRTIYCRCGARVARDVVIVDPCEVGYIAATLSENCPRCQANQNRDSHGAALPKAEGGRQKDEGPSKQALDRLTESQIRLCDTLIAQCDAALERLPNPQSAIRNPQSDQSEIPPC